MEKFYLEEPSIERKQDALDFIDEFHQYGSNINGTGGLYRYLDDYEGWIAKLEDDKTCEAIGERVPALTYFLVRESDKRIVGMINIRLALNERLKKCGGHIGYCIRPTERQKGYNKINLYLGLKACNEHGLDKVNLCADLDNPASWKTMEALGGVRTKEYFEDEFHHCMIVDYTIDVKESLKNHVGYEKFAA